MFLFFGLIDLIIRGGIAGSYGFVGVSRFKRGGFCQLDGISCIFMGVVAYIRGFVRIYSEWYVGVKRRFFLLVFLFVFRMLLLIARPSFFTFV